MLDWLLAPIDVTRSHEIEVYLAWHGRLMALAWGVLLPVGVLIARFFKILPQQNWPDRLDNPFWWYSHLALQYTGGILMLIAFWLVWQFSHTGQNFGLHQLYGYAVLALACTQFIAGWLRGSKGGPTDPHGSIAGDHYDMTLRRRIFERYHKSVGYLLILIAWPTILSGLWRVNAPRWMWLALSLWWLVLLLVFIRLQCRGFAVDTYQAIWGPDPRHPGNQRYHD